MPRLSSISKSNSDTRSKDKITSVTKLNDTASNYENIVFIGKHSSRNTVNKLKNISDGLLSKYGNSNLNIESQLFTVKEKVQAENDFNNTNSYNNYSSSNNNKNSPKIQRIDNSNNVKESEISSEFKKDSLQNNSDTISNLELLKKNSEHFGTGTFNGKCVKSFTLNCANNQIIEQIEESRTRKTKNNSPITINENNKIDNSIANLNFVPTFNEGLF